MIARGKVCTANGLMVEATMPPLALGTAVRITGGDSHVPGVVVAVRDAGCSIALSGEGGGIAIGAAVVEDLRSQPRLLPIDPAERTRVAAPMWTGVRAIDALLTIGRGARVGIFGAPGAGKSSLVESIARGVQADAIVLALVGERGREVERWFERCDPHTRIVYATSDRTALERVTAAKTAFARARALAGRGLHVALVLDSLARVAYALREIRCASGEPVGRGGYPVSVFSEIARMVESAGSFSIGSVTLFATVLHDGDDRDPVSEAARSLLDGHIQLSDRLARAGHFPAIDVLQSASRTMPGVVDARHRDNAGVVRAALARLEACAELRALGVDPADAPTRAAIACEPALMALLRQGPGYERPEHTLGTLAQTADTLERNYEYPV